MLPKLWCSFGAKHPHTSSKHPHLYFSELHPPTTQSTNRSVELTTL